MEMTCVGFLGIMEFEGFTFTPTDVKRELTPEERKERALALLAKPLDDAVKEARLERKLSQPQEDRKTRNRRRDRDHDKVRTIRLQLSEREILKYCQQFADIDVDDCDIKLQLRLKKDSHW